MCKVSVVCIGSVQVLKLQQPNNPAAVCVDKTTKDKEKNTLVFFFFSFSFFFTFNKLKI